MRLIDYGWNVDIHAVIATFLIYIHIPIPIRIDTKSAIH